MQTLMKPKEVRDWLRWSPQTLWRRRRDDGFPAPELVGKSYRYNRAKVLAWLQADGVDIEGVERTDAVA